MARSLGARAALVAALAILGCSDAPVERQTKPTFDWGYPEYSQYDANGDHVGTTDPACQ